MTTRQRPIHSPDSKILASHRPGSGRAAGVLLGLVLLVGLGVAGVLVFRTLSATPGTAPITPASPEGLSNGNAGPSRLNEANEPSTSSDLPSTDLAATTGSGIADAERLQELLQAVQKYAMDRDFAAAEAILRQAVGEYPEDQDLRVAFGEFLIGRERTDEAYEQYVAALAIGPRDHTLEYRAGLLTVQLGEHARAIEHFGAARQQRPAVPEYSLMLANEQLELGELVAAKASLVQVTVIDPNEPLAWGGLARIELRQNRAPVALDQARKAVALDPTQPVYRLYEAQALQRLSKPEEALLVLTGLPEAATDAPEFLRVIGECFGLLGRPADAAARYESAYERTNNPAFAFEVALWQQRAGDDEAARVWAERARDLGHRPAETWLASVGEG